MNAVFGAPINRPVNQSRILAGIRNRPANELHLAINILVRITKLPGAIARLMAGPPMSERQRYNRNVAEVRARSYEGLASAWFRPH